MEQALITNTQWVRQRACRDSQLSFALVICSFNDQLLMVRHHLRQSWEFPGGKREQGETIEQCAQRELAEEAGVIQTQLLPAGFLQFEKAGQAYVGQCFQVELKSNDSQPSLEIAECRLFKLDQLPKNLTYPDAVKCILQNMRLNYSVNSAVP